MRAIMPLEFARVTALALCIGGPLIMPLLAQDTAEVADLVVYRIAPSAVDSGSRRFDAVNYVVSARGAKADAPLLIFLPGTGGRPINTTAFENLAAHQGYRVIGLEYDDEPAVQQLCPRNPDPGCAEKVRRKRIFGEDATSLIDDKPNESIVARLSALLAALNRDHPSDGWSRYLKDGQPNWPSIAVSGLSQGAGMAAYIAQRTLVARVILFSSPWDSYGRFRTLAPWITRGPGATPPERWYGAFHRNENTADLIQRAYAMLHIPSDHVRVLTLEPARKAGDNPYHPSVVGNGVTPRLPNGTPAYLADWRALLGDVRATASISSASAAQSSPSVDLTGKWLFTVNTDGGSGTPTVTLTQKGDSLTGHYSSQLLGESELKGSVKDGKFSFVLQASVQGTAVTVTYTGTIESKDALKGSVDLGGMASGTFTAKRS